MKKTLLILMAMAAVSSCCGPKMADEITVTGTEGSEAQVELLQIRKSGKTRRLAGGSAFVGRNGFGKECEGDGKTPEGTFHAVTAFGIMPNPGTGLPYIDITPSVYACDEEGPFYNTIIDTDTTSHVCHGEKMYDLSPEYRYGIAIDFNPENIYPNGSAIFIHCKGEKKSTAGCVAVDEKFMIEILKRVTPQTRIIISCGQDRK